MTDDPKKQRRNHQSYYMSRITQESSGIIMFRHFKYKVIPVDLKAKVYVEGKEAFTLGTQRGHNPYTRHNLALATIWWHGWDTENEESNIDQKSPGSRR